MTEYANIRFERYDIYCGRSKNGGVPKKIGDYGWLGNPCVVNKKCIVCGYTHKDGGSTLACYEKYLINYVGQIF